MITLRDNALRALSKLAFAALAAAALTACGGGDGGASTPSTTEFPLAAGFASYLSTPSTQNFKVAGTVNINGTSADFSGSGTFRQTSPVAATFENKTARLAVQSINGTVLAAGQSAPLSATVNLYTDINSAFVGSSVGSSSYMVVTSAPTLPATARVGAKGLWYQGTIYSNSSKLVTLGTNMVEYSIEGESETTALLKFNITQSVGGKTQHTTAVNRITTSGTVTRITEGGDVEGGRAIYTYE